MAVCKWKKVKFKSFSQSEWQCLTCGETGYASHEKPPLNCVKIKFGKSFSSNRSSFFKKIRDIFSLKVGTHSFTFVVFIILVVLLLSFYKFKCNLYFLVGFESSVCASLDLVDQVHDQDYADGLGDTEGKTNICDKNENVDYSDVEEYMRMMKAQMKFLDGAFKGDPDQFVRNYALVYDMDEENEAFFVSKIDKCFGGDNGDRLASEVSRMNKFISEKMKSLYDLAYR